jgi:hypothetical protein
MDFAKNRLIRDWVRVDYCERSLETENMGVGPVGNDATAARSTILSGGSTTLRPVVSFAGGGGSLPSTQKSLCQTQ